MEDFYTYAYLRKDGTPYYIGKGRRYRATDNARRRRVRCPKDKSRLLYLKTGLTEAEAFKHEVYMIAVFGRKDIGTGILHNQTDGGEGSVGLVFTPEYRQKLSVARKARPNSKRTRKKISMALKGVKQSASHASVNGEAHNKSITLVHTETNEVRTFPSGKECANELGLHAPSLSALRKGKLQTHKKWRLQK